MKIKNICLILICLLLNSVCFAKNNVIVFFAENLDGVSEKVINKIAESDKFCLAVAFDENKYIKKSVKDLIMSNKIEPMLSINEPYFPIISKEVNVYDSIVFNKIYSCEKLLQNYNNSYVKLFETYEHGLYLKGASLNNETLDLFYKNGILWTIAKSNNGLQKGLFIKNNVFLFVLYKNFTTNVNKIEQWFSSVKKQTFVPVLLTSSHLTNEKFMLNLINFINKNKNIDVLLPTYAAYYGYDSDTIKDDLILKEYSIDIPKENLLKLYLADKEITEYSEHNENEEICTILQDEFSNMYSYNILNGIANNDIQSNRLFDISYKNIFKILNKELPNINEFKESLVVQYNLYNEEQQKEFCKFINIDDSIIINNDSNIITFFSVSKNNNYISFATDADLSKLDSIDIYIDMNEISYAGCKRMLQPLSSYFVPKHSWEYAIRITKENIYIYKFVAEDIEVVKTIPNAGSKSNVKILSSILRGNPYNWNYQVVAIKDGLVKDFIEDKDKKEKIFKKLPLQLNMFKYCR